jgi:pyruvate/2-oxoglutarate dehydrogenase complex dihydrolipoamide acyltransferase (E2) component
MVTLVNVPPYIALMKNYSSKPFLTKWFMSEGDYIELDQPLLVVETSKASLEIVAPASGLVFILHPAGQNVKIGDTVGMIAESKAELAEFKTTLMHYPLD